MGNLSVAMALQWTRMAHCSWQTLKITVLCGGSEAQRRAASSLAAMAEEMASINLPVPMALQWTRMAHCSWQTLAITILCGGGNQRFRGAPECIMHGHRRA